MYCHNCGSKVKDGAKFCTVCGTSLIEESTETEKQSAQSTVEYRSDTKQNAQPKQKRSYTLVWILLFAIIIGGFGIFRSTTKDVYVFTDITYLGKHFVSDADKESIIFILCD